MISDSVGNAGARIRFFRIAYGAAGPEQMAAAEIRSVLENLNHGSRVKCFLDLVEPKPREEVKLAFLALQCCETAMPFGGSVRISSEGGYWNVVGTAEKLKVDPDLWQILGALGTPAR
ncbi:histidine phosphotransferase family protein, partial [Cribrihabitans sp. XS_ASV171]